MSNSSTFVQLAASGAATLVTSYSLVEKVSQAPLIEHLFDFFVCSAQQEFFNFFDSAEA